MKAPRKLIDMSVLSSARKIISASCFTLAITIVAFNSAAQSSDSDKQILVRKNVKALSAEEKTDFVNAILRLKTAPSPEGDEVGNWYDHFVAAHLRKLVCYTDEPGQGGFGHYGADLLTWHREYMREFEAALSTVMGKPIAIPYWDWTDPESVEIVFADDFMGPAGDPENNYYVTSGPFKQGEWRINVKGFESTNPGQFDHLVRAIGTMEGMTELPSPDEVQQALLRPEYDVAPWGVAANMDTSFRSFVDGMLSASGTTCDGGAISVLDVTATLLHGTVHMWVGGVTEEGHPGSLSDTVTSPNDPVFWLHHANIDRIAETWWAANSYQYLPISGGPRGSNLNDRMWPYNLTHADVVVPTEQLGYTYDAMIEIDATAQLITAGDWVKQRGNASGHAH